MSGKGASLAFSVAQIRDRQGLSVELHLPASELLGKPLPEAVLTDPVDCDIDFSIGGDLILLQARLHGAWMIECSRCLAAHRAAFSADAEETYPLSSETIDLTNDLRDTVIMELPQRSLCREDCRGLCRTCGADLNNTACGCPPPDEPTNGGKSKQSPFDVLKNLKSKE